MMNDIKDVLAERHAQYGLYCDVANTSQCLQAVMSSGKNWDAMPTDMRESLQLIASKMGRLLNGNMEHIDSWHDIAGYATLIVERLKGETVRP